MKNKKRVFYLLLTLFFISAFILIKNQWSKIFPQKSDKVFANIKKEEVKEIEIEKENGKIKIYKNENRWFLKKNAIEYQADEEKVNQIISSFLNLKKIETISTNPKKFKDLGIDKQKIALKTTKNKNYQLYIGLSPSLDKNYLRADNQNEIFIGEGFNNILSSDDFRDLKVYLIENEEDIAFLELEYNNRRITLNKKGQDWYLNEKKLKKEKVNFFINDLATLKADDFLSKDTPLPLILPEMKIKIKEKGGEKIAYFIKKDENNYYLQIPGKKNLYLISSSYLSSFKKEEKDFLE